MAMESSTKVVLLGCGLVGKAVLKGMVEASATLAARFGITFKVMLVSESDAAVTAADAESLDAAEIVGWKAIKGNRLAGFGGAGTVIKGAEAVESAVLALAADGVVAIDCTATDKTTPLLKTFLERGGGVVLANKKPLADSSMADFAVLGAPAHESRCRYESSVGAGTPFVAAVTRAVKAGDTIKSVEGTFSGTLGYLTAGLQTGKSLSELVSSAHELGYTEPDPREDLGGTDVARKALILARTIGWSFELADVEIEALYPPAMQQLSVDEFKAAMTECDAEMAKRSVAASESGCVLRYVASVTASSLKVGMQAVPLDSPIGRLSGTANIMQLVSEHHPNGLVVQGAGAGAVITAHGVIADLVDIAQRMQK